MIYCFVVQLIKLFKYSKLRFGHRLRSRSNVHNPIPIFFFSFQFSRSHSNFLSHSNVFILISIPHSHSIVLIPISSFSFQYPYNASVDMGTTPLSEVPWRSYYSIGDPRKSSSDVMLWQNGPLFRFRGILQPSCIIESCVGLRLRLIINVFQRLELLQVYGGHDDMIFSLTSNASTGLVSSFKCISLLCLEHFRDWFNCRCTLAVEMVPLEGFCWILRNSTNAMWVILVGVEPVN